MGTAASIACLATALCLQPLAAQAAVVTYDFAGAISNPTSLTLDIPLGMPFSGQFTINTAAPDILPGREWQGMYQQGFAFSVTLGGITYASPAAGRVEVINNWSGLVPTIDRYAVQVADITATAPLANAFALLPDYASIWLDDTAASVFSTDALPSSLSLSAFNRTEFRLGFGAPGLGGFVNVLGPITSLALHVSTVPEPATGWMLLTGLPLIARMRRRHVRA